LGFEGSVAKPMREFSKFSDQEKALYQRVDEVLHYMWDPIGVCGVPEARDEYYSYLPTVFQMLINGNGAETIAGYLSSVSRESMGLGGNAARDFDVAEVLINWTDHIFGNAINRETVEITSEQMAELNRRIEDHEKHPEKGFPWSEVRERLRKLS
jgi:putative addiction module component (TIGR02574 family)